MFLTSVSKKVSLIVSVALVVLLATGCAPKKPSLEELESTVRMRYDMPEKQVLKYQTTNKFTQIMEVRGKSIEVVSDGTGLFTIISNGLKEGNYELDVTIDNISMSAKAMENEMNADMSPIIGKSFNMTLSPLGKELNLSGAESLKYEFEGTERNVASTFKALFPNLPEKPLNIGDNWTTKDTIIEKSGNGEIIIYTENKNTLDGFERINGRKCLKVTAQVTGTLSSKTKREGVDIISDGNIEATDTWYFDHENGVFIKMTSDGSGEGSMTVHAEEIVVIPMKRKFKNDVVLVE